jgi:hypothetical protein
MFYEYKIILITVMFLFAYLIVAWKNHFNRAAITSIRFFVAVLFIWFYLILCRLVVIDIDLELAGTEEERAAIYASDGAGNIGAMLFGWFPSLLVVTFVWAWVRVWRRLSGRCSKAE